MAIDTVVLLALPNGSVAAFPDTQVKEAERRAVQLGYGPKMQGQATAPDEPWLTSQQLAVLTGICDQTLEAMARRNELPCLRPGKKLLRFRMSEVVRALQARGGDH